MIFYVLRRAPWLKAFINSRTGMIKKHCMPRGFSGQYPIYNWYLTKSVGQAIIRCDGFLEVQI
jgi:hypothetical protein